MGPENDASPGSPNELASMLDQAQTTHAEPAASEPLRKRPAQEKLEKEIAHYDIEIEKHSKLSGAEPLSREAELKKLRAASEYKLKRLRRDVRRMEIETLDS
ncbi:hypothetical protein AAVH_21782 [Aphelenchoides avenae]|nr:hypothetical protein AAVH_21782 [Aphelenchus avenae]